MKPPTISRRFQFCMGHRVHGHESKCAHLHGHNYVAVVHARARRLDRVGRVIDFSVIKSLVGGWIEENWDHGFMLWDRDPLLSLWGCRVRHHGIDSRTVSRGETGPLHEIDRVEHKIYPLPSNPTAENIADFLLRQVCPEVLKDSAVEVHRVDLWETENCMACAEL